MFAADKQYEVSSKRPVSQLLTGTVSGEVQY